MQNMQERKDRDGLVAKPARQFSQPRQILNYNYKAQRKSQP